MKIKHIVITIVLMCIIGACMHFVCDVVGNEMALKVLRNIFPANETSWEHMKMYWFPFLVAGIIWCFKKREPGYIGGFVVSGVVAMLIQLGVFAIYQSFAGSSVLVLDIIFFMSDIVGCAILAFHLSERPWTDVTWILWVIVAIAITFAIVYLTYHPGPGYVFWDNIKSAEIQGDLFR